MVGEAGANEAGCAVGEPVAFPLAADATGELVRGGRSCDGRLPSIGKSPPWSVELAELEAKELLANCPADELGDCPRTIG